MGKTKAFNTRRTGNKYVTCPICEKKIRKGAYYNTHLKAGHNGEANYKIFNKNKSVLKKFINFIIKIVLLINEKYDIYNFIKKKLKKKKIK